MPFSIFGVGRTYQPDTQGGGWNDTVGDIIDISDDLLTVIGEIEDLFGDSTVSDDIRKGSEETGLAVAKYSINQWLSNNWLLIVVSIIAIIVVIFLMKK